MIGLVSVDKLIYCNENQQMPIQSILMHQTVANADKYTCKQIETPFVICIQMQITRSVDL